MKQQVKVIPMPACMRRELEHGLPPIRQLRGAATLYSVSF